MDRLRYIFCALFMLLMMNACSEDLQQPAFEYNIGNPAVVGSQYPNLHVDNTGMVTMSWISKIEEDFYAVELATFNDGSWSQPRTVNTSRDYFVNWADFPSAVSRDGDVVAAHWLRKIEGGPYAYNVNLVFPEEQARRWTDPITPHLDGTATEHGFVSMEPLTNDRVLAVWLDGRNTEGRGHDEYSDPDKSMTIRSAEVSRDGTINRKREIDGMVCDCCQTDLILTDDSAYVVYRGRTQDEIRDIYISRYDLESGEWNEPVKVHDDGWQINGCPVNGPRIDANGDKISVAWFTGADDSRKVHVVTSDDRGETFSEPEVISNDRLTGRADVVVSRDDDVYVSWLEERDEIGDVMMKKIGEENQSVRVGITSSSRRSGFPRMAETAEGILFAWTQTDPLVRVRTAFVPYDVDLSEIEDAEAPAE